LYDTPHHADRTNISPTTTIKTPNHWCGANFSLKKKSGPPGRGDCRRRRICNARGGNVDGVKNGLAVKVIVLRNDLLAEVVFEQKELGNPA
jgi:hypothetical protein